MTGHAHGDTTHEVCHTGLRNMHVLEMTAIELTERQVGRMEHYPEMAARLRAHRDESQVQAQRLEAILARHGTAPSAVKNAAMGVMGNVAAALHAPAPDEILKNTFANFAFEHQEITGYTSLLAMADLLGDTESVAPLCQSLAEEQSMAEFIEGQIVPTTETFMTLTAQGARAGI